MDQESVLEMLRQYGGFLEGHFLLSSGRHSGSYVQCALVLQHPLAGEQLGKALAERFQKDSPDCVIGPALGGVILAYEVARHLGTRGLFCERVNGQMRLRRGFTVQPEERVLVVEDVVTTGASVKETIQVVRQARGRVINVGTIVDRSGGKAVLGVPTESLAVLNLDTYDAGSCPLCEREIPLVKPGSRKAE